VHRDVKPGNLVIRPDGTVVLTGQQRPQRGLRVLASRGGGQERAWLDPDATAHESRLSAA
jgi:serine/threonine protein kinase